MLTQLEIQPLDKIITLEQNLNTSHLLHNIIEESMEQVMGKQFPYAKSKILRKNVFLEGASGAITVRVDSEMQLMFKYDTKRVAREVEGSLIMNKVLPEHTLPLLASDVLVGWICVPYLNATNLHSVIKNSKLSNKKVVILYDDFLRHMLSVWIRTYQKKSSNNCMYAQKFHKTTKKLEYLKLPFGANHSIRLSKLCKMPIYVNGVEFLSIKELVDQARELLVQNPAPQIVTSHGDEHAKNILVQNHNINEEPQWFLIDMPNVCTVADWVWSIVQMRHWWQVSYYIAQLESTNSERNSEVKFDISSGNLMIEYDLQNHIPFICQQLDKNVERLAQQIGHLFEDKTWSRRYQALMILRCYSLIPHYLYCKQSVLILIGELAKALKIANNHNHGE